MYVNNTPAASTSLGYHYATVTFAKDRENSASDRKLKDHCPLDKKGNRTPRSTNKGLQQIKLMLTMCLSKGLRFLVTVMIPRCVCIYFLSIK